MGGEYTDVNVAGNGGVGITPQLDGLMRNVYGSTYFAGGGGGGSSGGNGEGSTSGKGGLGGGKFVRLDGTSNRILLLPAIIH